MDEVFKLRDIPYYNLGIRTIFLDSVNSIYSIYSGVLYLYCISFVFVLKKLGKD